MLLRVMCENSSSDSSKWRPTWTLVWLMMASILMAAPAPMFLRVSLSYDSWFFSIDVLREKGGGCGRGARQSRQARKGEADGSARERGLT